MAQIKGASIRRFLDKPDKSVRAILLYCRNESFAHEAAQKLAAWALGKSDDPYAITKLGEDEIKRDSAKLGDALAAQSLSAGQPSCGRGSAAKARMSGVDSRSPGGDRARRAERVFDRRTCRSGAARRRS